MWGKRNNSEKSKQANRDSTGRSQDWKFMFLLCLFFRIEYCKKDFNFVTENFHTRIIIVDLRLGSTCIVRSSLLSLQCSSFVHHCFFVDLVATLFDKVKQLLQIRSPGIQDVIAVFCGLETDYTHGSVNLSNQCFWYNHFR